MSAVESHRKRYNISFSRLQQKLHSEGKKTTPTTSWKTFLFYIWLRVYCRGDSRIARGRPHRIAEDYLVRIWLRNYSPHSGREVAFAKQKTKGARESEAHIKSTELIIKALFAQAPIVTFDDASRVDTGILPSPFGSEQSGVCRRKPSKKG